jgi:hypothetical protein
VWAFTLALLTCLGIDFSNPLLPGVVRFGEEESVHALRAERSRTDQRPDRVGLPSAEPGRGAVVVTAHPTTSRSVDRPRPVLVAWRPRASMDHVRSGPSAPEDH